VVLSGKVVLLWEWYVLYWVIVFGAQMEKWESVRRCSTCCGLGFFLISFICFWKDVVCTGGTVTEYTMRVFLFYSTRDMSLVVWGNRPITFWKSRGEVGMNERRNGVVTVV
jgi:hypothetical protein